MLRVCAEWKPKALVQWISIINTNSNITCWKKKGNRKDIKWPLANEASKESINWHNGLEERRLEIFNYPFHLDGDLEHTFFMSFNALLLHQWKKTLTLIYILYIVYIYNIYKIVYMYIHTSICIYTTYMYVCIYYIDNLVCMYIYFAKRKPSLLVMTVKY